MQLRLQIKASILSNLVPDNMILVERTSLLWQYLSEEQRSLVEDGELLLENSHLIPKGLSDYSYLVFPFSKAYEGFLKKVFLDMKLIRPEEYYGDEIRIGRILNPHFNKEYGSVYNRLCRKGISKNGVNEVSEKLWTTWKNARNLVFHYFPHNFRRLTFEEAKGLVDEIIEAMSFALSECTLPSFSSASTKIKSLV
jgi:hypothetical protein